MGMRKRDYGNNGSGKGVSSPPLRRHRLHSEHAGNGGGYGDDYFQNGFQGVFTYFHDVCVFSSFRPFPTVQQRGRSAGVAVPDLRAFGQACRSLASAGTRDGKMVNKKIRVCFVFVCAAGLQLAGHVEAGTLLCPLGRLHRAVAVEVGAEVAVAADTGVAELLQQLADEQAQGRTLFGRTGILGTAFGIQSAFVADAHGVAVAASHVCAGLLQRAGG